MSYRLQSKPAKKQVRKPISDKFAPKRLAINFEPPMIIMEYMVIDSGKLYHHKMRLDSVMRRTNVNRMDVLNYVKNKHYLYFVSGKIKDEQLLKFIDKIMVRMGKNKGTLMQINENVKAGGQRVEEDEDFDYLNDDEEYEEDYEDYEDGTGLAVSNTYGKENTESRVKEESKNPVSNVFYKKYEEEEQKQMGDFDWDLDMEGSADFV